MESMGGTIRADIKPGITVMIVLKKDQRTNKVTQGIVNRQGHSDKITQSSAWNQGPSGKR